jgi:hypothetical protein
MMEISEQKEGYLFLKNLPTYQPFLIKYSEINDNTIQVDITGTGAINYKEKFCPELEMVINTNINKKLKEYSEITGHQPSKIGYTLNLTNTKKIDRKYNVDILSVQSSLVFEKPIKNATSYALTPTISLISSILIDETFLTSKINVAEV